MALFGGSGDELERRIGALEERVHLLERALAQAGIPVTRPAPPGGFHDGLISAEVRALAAGGDKLRAIKLLHEQSGLGLKDAKDAVDRL